MPIPVSCECGQSFRAKNTLAGKRVKCPKCGQALTIPDNGGGGSSGSGELLSASESGQLSLDELMRMDASSTALPQQPTPGQPMPGQPMPGQPLPPGQMGMPGMPGQFPQAGGMQPGMPGGFQPSPFGQPAAAPRQAGGNKNFVLAMWGLGGFALLAILGIVLMFALGGDDPPPIASGGSPGASDGTAGGGSNPNPNPTPKKIKPKNIGGGSLIEGFDTPEAALADLLKAIRGEDVKLYRATMTRAAGAAWQGLEQKVEAAAKQSSDVTAEQEWLKVVRRMKSNFADKIVQTQAAQMQGASRAVITVTFGSPSSLQSDTLAFTKGGNGKWHFTMTSSRAQQLIDAIAKTLPGGGQPAGPTLRLAVQQLHAKTSAVPGHRFPEDIEHKQAQLSYGWMNELLPYVGHKDIYEKFNYKKFFMEGANRKYSTTVIPQFLNPQDSRKLVVEFGPWKGLALSHFAGMSGIEDSRTVVAAALPRTDPRAGYFGYDRIASPKEVTDGTSNTIMVIGVEMAKPWVQGGGSTIRGARQPYFGEKPWGSNFASRGHNGTMVLMGDGSARLIPKDIDPGVFRAMCTIRGGESVDLSSYPAQPLFFNNTK